MTQRLDWERVEIGVDGAVAFMRLPTSLELGRSRRDKLTLLYRLFTGTWRDYLNKPSKLDKSIWNAVTPRFAVVDLLRPTLKTIVSAAYGGRITRRVIDAYNKSELESFMLGADFDRFAVRRVTDGVAYGTSYALPGWRDEAGRMPTFALLPPARTYIVTADDDVSDVRYIDVVYDDEVRRYGADGVYVRKRDSERWDRAGEGMGFLPVCVGYGESFDTTTPYGESRVWPAAEETRQVTYLNNDLMYLERLQSFSTMVIKGETVDTKDKQVGHGPTVVIRLKGDDPNSQVYYVTPQAAIDKINELVESHFERCATQCRVPIEIFTKSKAGTQQATGAALLSHKPLYDQVIEIQVQAEREERELLALVDAMITWRREGYADLNAHREKLKVEIVFERDSNPARTQAAAQTFQMLLDEDLIEFETAYRQVNPDCTDDDVATAKARREARRKIMVRPPALDMHGDEDDSE